MTQRPITVAGATLLIASSARSACGARSDDTAATGDNGSNQNKTTQIAVIAPLSGDLAARGLTPVEAALTRAERRLAGRDD